MAIISGLLELQGFHTKDSDVVDQLKISQARIKAMAFVHETLYETTDFSQVDFKKYLLELIKNLRNLYSFEKKEIAIKTHLEAFHMNVNQAIPLGLLCNELITNAYKHAFKKGQKGEITLKLQKNGHHIVLEVSDNGKGMPENQASPTENNNDLGLMLVRTLVRQLKGNLDISTKQGSTFKISFKQSENQGATNSYFEKG